MLTKLKKKVQQLMANEAKAAHKIGLTPNRVSIIGLFLSIFAGITFALASSQQPLWLLGGVALLMASGFCDTLDGVLARIFRQATPFGGFLDSLLDRYADLFVLAGVIVSGASMVVSPTFTLLIGLAAIISSFMVSYSRARAEAAGVKMESIGIAERPERLIIIAVSSLVAIFWLPALTLGIAVIAVLATITVLQRANHVYTVLRQKETDP